MLEALGLAAPAPAATGDRTGRVERSTRETRIDVEWSLDGSGRSQIATGIGFLDHMLTALAFHSLTDLRSQLHRRPVGGRAPHGRGRRDRAGNRRSTARSAIAPGSCATATRGRRWTRRSATPPSTWAAADTRAVDLPLRDARVGGLPASLVPHFVDSLSRAGRLAIHLEGHGDDDHHLVEAAFKALALALRQAVAADPGRAGSLPSTKGAI